MQKGLQVIITILFLAVFSKAVNAQTDTTVIEEPIIFARVEVMPEYVGGKDQLMPYINSLIIYPETAKAKRIQGRVILSCVILEDGSVGDIKEIAPSPDPALTEEAKKE